MLVVGEGSASCCGEGSASCREGSGKAVLVVGEGSACCRGRQC